MRHPQAVAPHGPVHGRARLFGLGALLLMLAVAPVANADPRAEDPESPKEYIAIIAKGEAAFVAKDTKAAIGFFQEAIKSQPTRMLALYRLGETQMSLGEYDKAIATLEGALDKKGSAQLKGKVMFLISLNFERAHKLEKAKTAWNSYITYTRATSDAKGYPQIAEQHIKVIERRMKDEVVYGAVKDRIAKREKEKAAEAAENAKNDKNNR